jgi:hypothetical protein
MAVNLRTGKWKAAFLLVGWVLPAAAAGETVHGRVTFVGTLGEERQPDGSLQARLRFRLSESRCGIADGLWTKSWDGTAWTPWQQVSPAPIASDPAAVYWGPSRIDVFALGTDGHMYTGSWDRTKSSWSGWSLVGNDATTSFKSGPAAAFEPGSNRVHLFARGTDDALWVNQWKGAWSGWTSLGGGITSDPAAVSWGPNRVDVFARGTDNRLYWKFWDGTAWSSWNNVGNETFTSGPGASSWGANRIDVFGRSSDNALYANAWNGAWTGWQRPSPDAIDSDPAPVSVAFGRVDVFARGTDSRLRTISREGTQWSGWTSLGVDRLASGPASVSSGNQVHLFARAGAPTDRWFHVTSGPMDAASQHNAANFRNAYNTLLSALLAHTVAKVQIDGVSDCDETQVQNLALERAQIGIYP